MSRYALFLAALIAGASYFFADYVVANGPVQWLWKGAGVGLLAAWAATRARSADGRLLALGMAVYAIADVLIDALGMTVGAVAFIAGHLVMIRLYLRHRRRLAGEDLMIAGLLVVAVPIAAFLLPDRRDQAIQVALYAAVLGAMATAALVSDFRRDRVWLGAMLFVASDLLIFARMGPLADSALPHFGIWPLYFAGQALMTWGVASELEANGK